MGENDDQSVLKQEAITPEKFQELCDQAMLAVDWKALPADTTPYDVTGAVIIEIHKSVCRHLGKEYNGAVRHLPPNERRIGEIVEMVSDHWSSPILIESSVRETATIALEHWRHTHSSEPPSSGEEDGILSTIMKFLKEKRAAKGGNKPEGL